MLHAVYCCIIHQNIVTEVLQFFQIFIFFYFGKKQKKRRFRSLESDTRKHGWERASCLIFRFTFINTIFIGRITNESNKRNSDTYSREEGQFVLNNETILIQINRVQVSQHNPVNRIITLSWKGNHRHINCTRKKIVQHYKFIHCSKILNNWCVNN